MLNQRRRNLLDMVVGQFEQVAWVCERRLGIGHVPGRHCGVRSDVLVGSCKIFVTL